MFSAILEMLHLPQKALHVHNINIKFIHNIFVFNSLNNMITPMIVIIAAITPLASIILTPFHLDMNCVMVCSDLSCSPVSAISDCQSPEMLAQEWSNQNCLGLLTYPYLYKVQNWILALGPLRLWVHVHFVHGRKSWATEEGSSHHLHSCRFMGLTCSFYPINGF